MGEAKRPRPPGPGVPRLMTLLAVVGAGFFIVPLVGLLGRTPWNRLPEILSSVVVRQALGLSLVTSLAATAVSALLGVPLAYLLARARFRGSSLLRALVTLPMVVPPVVGGAALLFALGRRGLVGGALYNRTGLLLPYSVWGVVVANTFVAMPFLIVTLEGALRGLDSRFEAAAATLGAGRWTIVRRVSLPMVAPSIGAGLVLAWARALGEFGATITFAGNLPGRTQTLPLAVFVALEGDRDAAIAMSLVLVAVSLVVLVAMRDRWWRSR